MKPSKFAKIGKEFGSEYKKVTEELKRQGKKSGQQS